MCNRKCDKCGKCVPAGYCYCDECREVADDERWSKLPKVKWNGEGGIYSEAYDEYFWDEDAAEEWLVEHDLKSWDALRLVICEPRHASPLSVDTWEDELPDEGGPPAWLEDAIEEFNEKIKDQPPMSYEPVGRAVDTSDWELPKEDDDV